MGVGSIIVFSAGFAEAGEEGREAQRELARIAAEHGMLIEGPNCLGMVNYVDRIPLTFVVTPPQPGVPARGAAIVSQSGALAAVIAVNMRHHRIPLTYSVSTGNEAASGVEDFLEHLIEDETTRVSGSPYDFLSWRGERARPASRSCFSIRAEAKQRAPRRPRIRARWPVTTKRCTRWSLMPASST
jgi:acyl-CoA synthetase (NDP forming)